MGYSGVFKAKKKDGTEYYRSSITFKEKHISLGSFTDEEAAGAAYAFARGYLDGKEEYLPEEYEAVASKHLDFITFDRWIMLLNLKKTGMYCKNPVYLYGNYFVYYLDRQTELKFGADQFFFFRSHKLQKRGGHIFYSDYGMQCGLLARFGIKNYAVEGKDYIFKNGDSLDFRFGNLVVINKFNGVFLEQIQGRKKFEVKIHLRGSLKVGSYNDEIEAAIAYNKAADCLEEAIRKRSYSVFENHVKKNGCLDDENEITKVEGDADRKKTVKSTAHTTGNTTNVENKILSFKLKNSTIYRLDKYPKSEDAVYARRTNVKKKDKGVLVKNHMILRSQMARIVFKSSGYSEKEEDKKGTSTTKNHDKIRIYRYRRWKRNYIEGITKKEYINIYESLSFSKNFRNFLKKL